VTEIEPVLLLFNADVYLPFKAKEDDFLLKYISHYNYFYYCFRAEFLLILEDREVVEGGS